MDHPNLEQQLRQLQDRVSTVENDFKELLDSHRALSSAFAKHIDGTNEPSPNRTEFAMHTTEMPSIPQAPTYNKERI